MSSKSRSDLLKQLTHQVDALYASTVKDVRVLLWLNSALTSPGSNVITSWLCGQGRLLFTGWWTLSRSSPQGQTQQRWGLTISSQQFKGLTWTTIAEGVLHATTKEIERAMKDPKKNSGKMVTEATQQLCYIFGKIEDERGSIIGAISNWFCKEGCTLPDCCFW